MVTGRSKQIRSVIAGLFLLFAPAAASAQDLAELCAPSEATDPQPLHINGAKPLIYKVIGDTALRLHIFSPAGHTADANAPAAVFFYGGGFVMGDIRRFQTQATHLALNGMVTVLVDYRVTCRHDSTIMDSVSDAKSAMRWVRGHADELGIDPSRIAAVGSSAGGMMVAATALVPGFDDPRDDDIDARPNALVLYNPGLDTGSPRSKATLTSLQGEAVANRGNEFSPLNHLEKGQLPPTIIFQGTADELTPFPIAREFCSRANALDFQCQLVSYAGAPHGFTEVWMGLENASLGTKTECWQQDTSRRTDAFLVGLGWLPRGLGSAKTMASECQDVGTAVPVSSEG